ncbi:hypothetical protein [Mycoplasma simbae]|uniref:hypothetical protein n=1 Tax=Mycoplasma simbae TaxID=36744 RepID=UPI0004954A8C|nr:hypothetical protein [Mycoplasma simbae]
MSKKRIGFLSLSVASLTAFPMVATACGNQDKITDDKKPTFESVLTVTVREEDKSKPASQVQDSDITLTISDKYAKDYEATLVSHNVKENNKTTLVVSVNVVNKITKESKVVVKEITGFAAETPSQGNPGEKPQPAPTPEPAPTPSPAPQPGEGGAQGGTDTPTPQPGNDQGAKLVAQILVIHLVLAITHQHQTLAQIQYLVIKNQNEKTIQL